MEHDLPRSRGAEPQAAQSPLAPRNGRHHHRRDSHRLSRHHGEQPLGARRGDGLGCERHRARHTASGGIERRPVRPQKHPYRAHLRERPGADREGRRAAPRHPHDSRVGSAAGAGCGGLRDDVRRTCRRYPLPAAGGSRDLPAGEVFGGDGGRAPCRRT